LRSAWSSGRRPIVAAGTSALVGLSWLGNRVAQAGPLLHRLGDERAGLPWQLALARLPGSMVMSTQALPVWGAFLQVLVVLGLAEMLVGKARTVVVAFLAHAIATLSARVMIAIPSGALSLPVRYLRVRDTGPSAAVVGVGIFLAVRFRAWWSLAVGLTALVVEVAARPDLAGREHICAIAVGLAAAFTDAFVSRRRSTLSMATAT